MPVISYQRLFMNAINNNIYDFLAAARPGPPDPNGYGLAWDWFHATPTNPVTSQPASVDSYMEEHLPNVTTTSEKGAPNNNWTVWQGRLNDVFTSCDCEEVYAWLNKEYALGTASDPPSVPDFVIEWTKPKLPPPQNPTVVVILDKPTTIRSPV